MSIVVVGIIAILLLSISISYDKGIQAGKNQQKARERLRDIWNTPQHPMCRCAVIPKGHVVIPVDKIKFKPPTETNLKITLQEYPEDLAKQIAQKFKEELDKRKLEFKLEPKEEPKELKLKPDPRKDCTDRTPSGYCVFHKGPHAPSCASIICPKGKIDVKC